MPRTTASGRSIHHKQNYSCMSCIPCLLSFHLFLHLHLPLLLLPLLLLLLLLPCLLLLLPCQRHEELRNTAHWCNKIRLNHLWWPILKLNQRRFASLLLFTFLTTWQSKVWANLAMKHIFVKSERLMVLNWMGISHTLVCSKWQVELSRAFFCFFCFTIRWFASFSFLFSSMLALGWNGSKYLKIRVSQPNIYICG